MQPKQHWASTVHQVTTPPADCTVSLKVKLLSSPVMTVGNKDISDLKELIHEKGKNGVLGTVDAKELMLLKVTDIHLELSINIVTGLS